MTHSLFLSRDDLKELTGKKIPKTESSRQLSSVRRLPGEKNTTLNTQDG